MFMRVERILHIKFSYTVIKGVIKPQSSNVN